MKKNVIWVTDHKTEAKPSTPNESGKASTPSKEPFLVVILLLFSQVQHLKDLGFYTNSAAFPQEPLPYLPLQFHHEHH
jgi:hypothetical protein